MIPSADMLAQELEETLSDGLTDDDRYELQMWENGRELQSIVNTRGWEIVVNTLETYVAKANEDLIGLAPGHPDVITAHAAVSAANDLVNKFKQDIHAAVEASHRSPKPLKKAAYAAQQP